MNAVNITVGGLIASIFFIFLCISLHAEQYYKELHSHHDVKNIKAVTLKPTLILRDRSSNTITHIKVTNPLKHKPLLVKEVNCTLTEHKKEENSSIKKIEPLNKKSTVYPLSDNTISDTNISLSKTLLENIQDKISTLLNNKTITFKKNSGKLSKEGKEVLDELIALLSNQKGFTIEIQGHTDAGGKAKVNQWISQMRANRVKKYLVQQGLSSENIQAKGFGERELLFINKPYSQKNRRVEIYIKRRENARIND